MALVATTVAVLTPSSSAAVDTPPTCATAGLTVTALGGPNFYIDGGTTPEFRSGYTGYRVTNSTGAALDDVWVSLSGFTGGSLGLAAGQSPTQRLGSLTSGQAGSRFWYLTASGTSAAAQTHTITAYRHNPALSNSSVLCSTTGGFSSVADTIAAAANKVTGITVTGGAPTLGSTFTVQVTGNTGTIGAGLANDTESFWMTPAVTEAWPADAFRLVGTSLRISPDGSAPQQTYTDILRLADLDGAQRPYAATYTFQAVGFTSSPTMVKPMHEIASGTQVKHTDYDSRDALPTIAAPVNDLVLGLAGSVAELDTGGGTVSLTAEVSGTAGAILDSFVLTPPPGTTPVAGSVTWDGQPVADPVWRDGTLVFPGPFTVPTTDVELSFQVEVDGDPGGQTFSFLGAIGPSYIGTASSPVDGSNPATFTVAVNTGPTAEDPTATIAPSGVATWTVDALATDVDGDALTVTSVASPAHGTASLVAGAVVYAPDDGFSGTDTFTYVVSDGRGGNVTGTVSVLVSSAPDPDPDPTPDPDPAAQTITFDPITDRRVGDTLNPAPTATSGLAVTLTTQTPTVCALTAGTVTALTPGTCTLTADQAGNTSWAAAPTITRSFTITAVPAQDPDPLPDPDLTPDPTPTPTPAPVPAAQTIEFRAPAVLLSGSTPVPMSATSTSGLPVTLAALSGDCSLTPVGLVAEHDTTCTVGASQPGTPDFAPAAAVIQEIRFVSPVDDDAAMASALDGPAHLDVAVMANDPAGLALASTRGAGNGSTRVIGDAVIYTPVATFHGRDEFSYAVSDVLGRTATAVVRVVVANAAPEVSGARVRQLSGSTTTVPVTATDPNGDAVHLTTRTTHPDVDVAVTGHDVRIHPGPGVTGWVSVRVKAADDFGGARTAEIRDLVRPTPVAVATRTLSTAGTRVAWRRADADGARYRVTVDGEVVCTTSKLECTLDRVLGPDFRVDVRVLGRDGTVSTRTAADPRGHHQVLLRTVYFASGESTLGAKQTRKLASVAHEIRSMGFHVAQVSGYTDSDGGAAYNLALSRLRTRMVADYLDGRASIDSRQAWFGYDDPVASNASAAGKALNRRVEILVSY